MILFLPLNRFCIQTGMKRAYNALISEYFNAPGPDADKQGLENRIEALKFLLERADFGLMRSRYPELRGETQVTVTLTVPEKFSESTLEVANSIIPIKWKSNGP